MKNSVEKDFSQGVDGIGPMLTAMPDSLESKNNKITPRDSVAAI